MHRAIDGGPLLARRPLNCPIGLRGPSAGLSVVRIGPGEDLLNRQFGASHADGSFDYIPAAAFSGLDFFTYRISDGAHLSETARTILNVTNRQPRSVDDHYFVAADGTLISSEATGVLANDTDDTGDHRLVSLIDMPSHGTVSLASDGSFIYIPAAPYVGLDRFTYRVSDMFLRAIFKTSPRTGICT